MPLTILAQITAVPGKEALVRAELQTHMNAPHLAAYGRATEGAVANFVLHEMTRIA